MNLLDLLFSSLSSRSSVNSLSKKTGISSDLIQKLLIAALPILIKYLTRNAGSGDGAKSLASALTQHTDKKAIEQQIEEADETDGNKIINHIFGNDTNQVISGLSAQVGLQPDQTTQTLGQIAPALMSTLFHATSAASKADNNFDLGDIAALFKTADNKTDNMSGLPAISSAAEMLLGSLTGGTTQAKQEDTSVDGTELLGVLAQFLK